MDVTSYIVIGAAVSLIVQYLKNKYGTQSGVTIGVVIGLSIITGTVYFLVKDTSFWQPIVSILGFAGAVYVYILKRFED